MQTAQEISQFFFPVLKRLVSRGADQRKIQAGRYIFKHDTPVCLSTNRVWDNTWALENNYHESHTWNDYKLMFNRQDAYLFMEEHSWERVYV